MCKPRVRSLLGTCGGSGARRCGSVGGWTPMGREGMGIGLGVGEGGGIDEEREPILMGVAGFLEGPTMMGVGTLVRTMFGMPR